MADVSVIVAAYRCERELPLLLESLCTSPGPALEVCLCDDASPDGTWEAAAAFAGRLELKAVRNEANRGVTFSRNRALELASAPLLLFVDADVRLPPGAVATLARLLREHEADVVEGIYSDVALDDDPVSRYYALFIRHSFLGAGGPRPYNVFNGWCALARREVLAALGGHKVVRKGVEVENESLGRRIAAAGFKLLLTEEVAADHHWGGWRKLAFIMTSRVYWWVKVFFADGCRFESALTTRSYAWATLALPASALAALGGAPAAALLLAAVFLRGYGPFYRYAAKRRGTAFACWCAAMSAVWAFPAAASAAYSAAEEVALLAWRRRGTLDPEDLRA